MDVRKVFTTQLFLLCQTLYFLAGVLASNNGVQVSLDRVTLTNADATLTLTVMYSYTTRDNGSSSSLSSARLPINVTWRPRDLDLEPMHDFTYSHRAENGQGQSTMSMQHSTVTHVGWLDVELHNEDFMITMTFKGPDHLPTLSSGTTVYMGGLALHLENEFSQPVRPGDEVVFQRKQHGITFYAYLRSSVLDDFDISLLNCLHSRLTYSSKVIVRGKKITQCGHGYQTGRVVERDQEWYGSGIERYTSFRVFSRRSSTTGIFRFGVNLRRRGSGDDYDDGDRVVSRMSIRQNLYLKRRPTSEVIRKNTVWMKSSYMQYLNNEYPGKIRLSAIGNPQPVIRLSRACPPGDTPPEPEVVQIEIISRYEVRYLYRVRNPRKAARCVYAVLARSGSKEIHRPLTIALVDF